MFLRFLLLLLAGSAFAGQAVFSLDGQRVFLLGEGAVVNEVELATAHVAPLNLGVSGELIALAVSNSGHLLACTERTLWAYNLEKRRVVKVGDAPPKNDFAGVACDPKSGGLLLTLADGAGLWLPKNAEKPESIFIRRVRFLESPVFSADGRLFFGTEGDLWVGQILDTRADGGLPWTLTAFRFGPVATRETSQGTPAQTGARDLAIAGEWLYTCIRRLGGSGWGSLARVKNPWFGKPPAPDGDNFPADLSDHLALYQRTLGTLEVLGEQGGASYLCASRDGRRVFYRATGKDDVQQFWLSESGGAPRLLPLKLPR